MVLADTDQLLPGNCAGAILDRGLEEPEEPLFCPWRGKACTFGHGASG
jgi:hypothetical protein